MRNKAQTRYERAEDENMRKGREDVRYRYAPASTLQLLRHFFVKIKINHLYECPTTSTYIK